MVSRIFKCPIPVGYINLLLTRPVHRTTRSVQPLTTNWHRGFPTGVFPSIPLDHTFSTIEWHPEHHLAKIAEHDTKHMSKGYIMMVQHWNQIYISDSYWLTADLTKFGNLLKSITPSATYERSILTYRYRIWHDHPRAGERSTSNTPIINSHNDIGRNLWTVLDMIQTHPMTGNTLKLARDAPMIHELGSMRWQWYILWLQHITTQNGSSHISHRMFTQAHTDTQSTAHHITWTHFVNITWYLTSIE